MHTPTFTHPPTSTRRPQPLVVTIAAILKLKAAKLGLQAFFLLFFFSFPGGSFPLVSPPKLRKLPRAPNLVVIQPLQYTGNPPDSTPLTFKTLRVYSGSAPQYPAHGRSSDSRSPILVPRLHPRSIVNYPDLSSPPQAQMPQSTQALIVTQRHRI